MIRTTQIREKVKYKKKTIFLQEIKSNAPQKDIRLPEVTFN